MVCAKSCFRPGTLHGRTPFAVGGWAALQVVNGRVSRSISAPNPPDYPPTSDFSEHIAIHIALMHASDDDPLHFVTDCASVILYHQQALQGKANAATNVLGGSGMTLNSIELIA